MDVFPREGGKLVKRVVIEQLFGRYSYDLSLPESHSTDPRYLILYGDNGTGKSTILGLLFALLATNRNQGEKSHLLRTPFRKFHVGFHDGTYIEARRTVSRITGPYTIAIKLLPQSRVADHVFEIEDQTLPDGRIIAKISDDKYVELLAKTSSLGVSLLYLPDHRNTRTSRRWAAHQSAHISPDLLEMIELHESNELRVSQNSPRERRAMVFDPTYYLDVRPVLEEMIAWLRQEVISKSNVGEQNANSIYLDVVERLTWTGQLSGGHNEHANLIAEIERLTQRSSDFSKYALMSPFSGERLTATLSRVPEERRDLALNVLRPFVEGLEARVNALDNLQRTLSTYIDTINSFLLDKWVSFSMESGVTIQTKGGSQIEPNRLSSGERQLLLLLSNTVLANGPSNIFIVDEPELSLNVKWQRRLLRALSDCAGGRHVQYILATHSLELLAGYRQNVVKLEYGEEGDGEQNRQAVN